MLSRIQFQFKLQECIEINEFSKSFIQNSFSYLKKIMVRYKEFHQLHRVVVKNHLWDSKSAKSLTIDGGTRLTSRLPLGI